MRTLLWSQRCGAGWGSLWGLGTSSGLGLQTPGEGGCSWLISTACPPSQPRPAPQAMQRPPRWLPSVPALGLWGASPRFLKEETWEMTGSLVTGLWLLCSHFLTLLCPVTCHPFLRRSSGRGDPRPTVVTETGAAGFPRSVSAWRTWCSPSQRPLTSPTPFSDDKLYAPLITGA